MERANRARVRMVDQDLLHRPGREYEKMLFSHNVRRLEAMQLENNLAHQGRRLERVP